MNTREEYVSIPEAAEILNLKRNRVGVLCREGRFQGAVKIANNWVIPREAIMSHKPLPPGVKPLKTKLAAEKAGYLAKASGTPVSTRGRRRTFVTILNEATPGEKETSQAKAWREFFEVVNTSGEEIPAKFERLNFTREIEL